jgi:type IV pilus biogenesis protein CpaD/CtpE
MAMSSKLLRLAPLAATMALAGCETVHANRSLDPGFGESARYNAALQVIDPDPLVSAEAMKPGSNGAVGTAAAKRYRTDKVKPVEKITTTSTTGGAGPS